ncbi:hypothetical protein [Bradyrhizobium sp. Leo121]|uniref:hypothetical protein n=1 Tax=Bradyrhizobium sp. Leo121 TaxID=1571195 RepID=UPI0013EEF102|nr:hypothetical protein [Bradyrhizobium sp. Leo121]
MSRNILLGVALAVASLALANTGSAEDAPSVHKEPWPIRNGRNYQPTERELRALHQEDVTPNQAREIDRLYDQLLASSEKIRKRHPAGKE